LSILVDHLKKDFDYVILNQSRRKSDIKIKQQFEPYLHKSFAEEAIMIHEKIVSEDKQSVESIESESSNAESSRSMKDNRRVSIISIEIFDDASEDAKTLYHIRNMNQLRY
jgi:hypothetical protein